MREVLEFRFSRLHSNFLEVGTRINQGILVSGLTSLAWQEWRISI